LREIEDLSEYGDSPQAIVERWHAELEAANKKWDKWRKRAEKIVKLYTDEARSDSSENATKKINILWSNIETIKPALYAKTPLAEVGRRNKDKDPVGREASEVIERCLDYCNDVYDFDGIMKANVHDFALGALGISRVIYDPVITGEGEGQKVSAEYAKTDYVNPFDFTTNDARNWGEVRWVAFRHFLTRKQLRQMNPKIADQVVLDHLPSEFEKDHEKATLFKKATAYEIWDKENGIVLWIAKTYSDAPIKAEKPFCEFNEFFPIPRPMFGVQGSSIIPTPDFALYQDQVDEINELTNKIYKLTDALKVAGVYDGKSGAIERLLSSGNDNILIPVDNWGNFQASGGMDGAVSFLPIEQVAKALIAAYDARDRAKADLYEATGLSDIVRGASDPNETATAQQIKNQWGSLRIRDRQKEVQRFARDLMRLKAEVIAERFSLETLQQMSGVQLLTEQDKQMLGMKQQQGQPLSPDEQEALKNPTWEQVYGLLQNDRLRSFSIDIETDSTIEPDEQADKQARVELVTAVAQFLTGMAPIVQGAPEVAPLVSSMLQFAVRGFKVGGELETTIENVMDQTQQRLSQPQPNPEMEKAKMQHELEQKKHQDNMQLEVQKHQDTMQLEVMKAQSQIALEKEKTTQQHELAKNKADQDAHLKERELGGEGEMPTFSKKAEKEQAQAKTEELMTTAIQALNNLAQVMSAPNEVIRGPDGRAAGTRKVLQ
jgi:hypothetical protein